MINNKILPNLLLYFFTCNAQNSFISNVIANVIFKDNHVNYCTLINSQSIGHGSNTLLVTDRRETHIDGKYHSIYFSCITSSPVLEIKNNSKLIFLKTVFQNFNPQAITIEPGSQITLADNCYIQWTEQPIEFTSSQNQHKKYLQIAQTVTLDLSGKTLNLSKDINLILKANCNLIIKNGSLIITTPNAGLFFEINSKLTLKNMRVILNKTDLLFCQGSIDIAGKCKFTTSTKAQINFTSQGFLNILPKATLTLGPNITFLYNPKTAKTERLLNKKKHFCLKDSSSTLILDQATLSTVNYGLALEHGTIIIQNRGAFKTIAKSSTEAESYYWHLGTACTICIMPNASLACEIQLLHL